MAPRRLRPGALNMDTQRLILLFIFGFSVLMLWEAWEREHRPKPAAAPVAQTATQTGAPAAPQAKAPPSSSATGQIAATGPAEPGETIRNTYVVDVSLQSRNGGGAPVSTYAYFQLTHDGKPEGNRNTVAETFGAQSFTGFAVYTDEHKFQKVHPADLDKGKPDHVKEAKDGWLAFVQHYFVSAWLAPQGLERDYVMEKRQDGTYAARLLVPVSLAPGASTKVDVPLYAGPQEKRRLEAAAPGLDL